MYSKMGFYYWTRYRKAFTFFSLRKSVIFITYTYYIYLKKKIVNMDCKKNLNLTIAKGLLKIIVKWSGKLSGNPLDELIFF